MPGAPIGIPAQPRNDTPAPAPEADTGDDVYVIRALTPLAAREANRSAVTALLDTAGIPHFAVRGTSDHGTVVAVAEDDRERVLNVIFRGLGQYPGHISTVRTDQVRPARPLSSRDARAWRDVRTAAALQ
ncbi:hypothetical protein V2J85_40865, partial [Streptomyces sp. DSM 41528]|nr:hypothetical protein [Streptomyces sp. DSM 41528]